MNNVFTWYFNFVNFSKLQFIYWCINILLIWLTLIWFLWVMCNVIHARLLSIFESIPWNLFSLNCPFASPANDCFVLMNSSALICAFVYRTSGLALGLVYFLNIFICIYLFWRFEPAASPKLLPMIPIIGVYGLFALPYVNPSLGRLIPLWWVFKAEIPNGILTSLSFL